MLKIGDFLSAFYPNNCTSCQEGLVKGESYICLNCELNFGETIFFSNILSDIEQLFWGKVKIESAFALYQYLKEEKLQQIIHEFKYQGNHRLAVKMGEIIGLNYKFISKDIDAISFVPLHPSKQKKRGYNQAQKLAEGFSNITGKKVIHLLKRFENTETQTDKGVFERFKNMEDKFRVVNVFNEIKHVLLIDDVITTGATLAACASKLTKKGIRVSVVSLSYRGLNF
tara:strand:+ start:725 stop:1405 length:681 start_codon:yes stop_codon:yes gene_type:complete